MVHQQVRNDPVDKQMEPAKVLSPDIEQRKLEQNADVRHDNEPEVALVEDWGDRVEV